jgi:hypothetical protein
MSQCTLVPHHPQSPEAIYHALNGYLNQFGEVNVGLGGFITACIMSSFFPQAGHLVTRFYIALLATAALVEMYNTYYN